MQQEKLLIWFEGLKIEFSPVDTKKHTHKNKNTEHILCGRGIASAMILKVLEKRLIRWLMLSRCR